MCFAPVHSGCSDKIPQTGPLRNNRNSTSLSWKLGVQDWGASLVRWAPPSRSQTAPWIHTWQVSEAAPWGLLCKSTDLIHDAPASWSERLPKAPPPNKSTLPLRVSTWGLWGTQKFRLSHISMIDFDSGEKKNILKPHTHGGAGEACIIGPLKI